MKTFITTFLLIIFCSIISFAENPILIKDKPIINLNLPKDTHSEENIQLGTMILVTGLFLSGIILAEGDKNYTSSLKNYNGHYIRTTDPFFYQSPRQIFFFSGIVFSVSGVVIMFK